MTSGERNGRKKRNDKDKLHKDTQRDADVML